MAADRGGRAKNDAADTDDDEEDDDDTAADGGDIDDKDNHATMRDLPYRSLST